MTFINTESVNIDPYEVIKLNADIIDSNYFSTPNSKLAMPQFTSKDLLLFQLQYFIRYSQALEKRVKELESKINKEEGKQVCLKV